MTPGARVAAAIEILDEVLEGAPAERTLTRWARGSRFAGSKDRGAVRDLVFDALRRRRSLAHRARDESGRGLMLALAGPDAWDGLFTGEGFAPPPVTSAERAALTKPLEAAPFAVAHDIPDFLEHGLRASLGPDLEAVLAAQTQRAPVDLRVNPVRATPAQARAALADEGVATDLLPQLDGALRVTKNARRVQSARAYRSGMVELQDLSSQIVAAQAGAWPGMSVLDYCAGGGGKALALGAAMAGQGRLLAHDINPGRMKDLPQRAARAGLHIEMIDTRALASLMGTCDLVMVDAPCSGCGAWRRNPDGKWRLTAEGLARLLQIQADILTRAQALVRPGGRLVYATCSLLQSENSAQVDRFLAQNPTWTRGVEGVLTPLSAGDGFYYCALHAP